MTNRLSCCVPFCRRTRRNPEGFVEWVCPIHWPMTDKELRTKRSALMRRAKRKGWTAVRISIEQKYWNDLKKQAIERAAGI